MLSFHVQCLEIVFWHDKVPWTPCNRKGFPESYNIRSLISFLYDLKSGIGNLKVPVYSHLTYDIIPDKFITVDRPDILLLEGLNVLQTPQSREVREPQFFVSDFFDFSIYIDADPSYIKKWFIERFKVLMRTAFSKKESYFNSYSAPAKSPIMNKRTPIMTGAAGPICA